MPFDRIRLTTHAMQRLLQRHISEDDIRIVMTTGEVIENYLNDIPRPSYLILGWRDATPLHVVAADDPDSSESIIITAYRPDALLWEDDFRRRKA